MIDCITKLGLLWLILLEFMLVPAWATPMILTCTADDKPVIDGCGFDYKDMEFKALPGSQAWSKMRIYFDSYPSPKVVEVGIFGAYLSEVEEKLKTQVLLSDDKRVSFFYEVSRDNPTMGSTRDSWFLTYFPKSMTLYFSLHSYSNFGAEFYSSAPIVRGQVFKATCRGNG